MAICNLLVRTTIKNNCVVYLQLQTMINLEWNLFQYRASDIVALHI